MMRRLPAKKILVASIGVGAVSYVVACANDSSSSFNPVPAQPQDSGADVSSSGNLMGPTVDANVPVDTGADVSSSGNLMGPLPDAGAETGAEAGADAEASDAGDGGG